MFLLKFKALMEILRCMVDLKKRDERFDIIIGDLTDPMEGGIFYQLYTKYFYEIVLKPKLSHIGVSVAQL